MEHAQYIFETVEKIMLVGEIGKVEVGGTAKKGKEVVAGAVDKGFGHNVTGKSASKVFDVETQQNVNARESVVDHKLGKNQRCLDVRLGQSADGVEKGAHGAAIGLEEGVKRTHIRFLVAKRGPVGQVLHGLANEEEGATLVGGGRRSAKLKLFGGDQGGTEVAQEDESRDGNEAVIREATVYDGAHAVADHAEGMGQFVEAGEDTVKYALADGRKFGNVGVEAVAGGDAVWIDLDTSHRGNVSNAGP